MRRKRAVLIVQEGSDCMIFAGTLIQKAKQLFINRMIFKNYLTA